MATKLVVELSCDRCGRVEAEASTHRIAIDGDDREVDLCPGCRDALITPLLEVLPTGRRPTEQAPREMFDCDQCPRQFPSKQGLNRHRGHVHKPS